MNACARRYYCTTDEAGWSSGVARDSCVGDQGAQGPAAARVTIGAKEIDFDTRRVKRGDQQIRLTPKEFDLLRHLVAHPNKVLTHRELLQAVWGPDYGDEVDQLRVVVNQLRKKIEAQPSKPKYLLTEPWVGYRLDLKSDS